jgi:hypothetical protein
MNNVVLDPLSRRHVCRRRMTLVVRIHSPADMVEHTHRMSTKSVSHFISADVLKIIQLALFLSESERFVSCSYNDRSHLGSISTYLRLCNYFINFKLLSF